MSSNPKFKAIEESAVEGLEVPGLEDIGNEAIHAVVDEPEEHTKEHVLGDIHEAPPTVKRGKAAMFPNAKSGKEGFKNFVANLKSNPMKLLRYAGAAAVVAGVGFMGFELRQAQNRIARLERNASQVFNVMKEMQKAPAGQQAAGNDYSGAINEIAGKLSNLDRRMGNLEQAPAPKAQAASAPAAKPAAKAKTLAKNSKAAGRSPASVKKATKKRH